MKHSRVVALVVILLIASVIAVFKLPTKLGLDLAGGVRVVLRAEKDKLPPGEEWEAKHLQAVINTIRNRVDAWGVSEPLIQPKGEDQVVVEVPKIRGKGEDAAIAELKSTAQMEFWHLRNVRGSDDQRHRNAKYEMDIGRDDKGNETYEFRDRDGKLIPLAQILKESKLILTGKDLKAESRGNKNTQPPFGPIVELKFTPEGRQKFADFTKRNRGEFLAIILEDRILSAPYIRQAILDGEAIIEGGFRDVAEAQQLADFLNAGALPVPLELVQKQSVEATLGKASVDQSVMAGIIGLAVVVVFMVGYYLLPGLIADLALGIYALLTFALFKAIPVTLTLPGIAAYILSIGMAVDANILIFERLKEELRTGKTLRAAIDAGFSRAFTSIFDSNMCTIITCAILGWLGTGPIKGFALVLALGVVISMFTAITVTRTILHLIVNTRLGENPRLFGLGRQWVTGQSGRQANIVGRMAVWFALSAVVLIPGLFFWGTEGLKRGIDFTGGSFLQVEFKQPVANMTIKNALDGVGLSESMVQRIKQESPGDPVLVSIRTKEISHERAGEVKATLEALGGDVQSEELVGATISNELTSNAIKAIILASIAIVLYLSLRFAVGGFMVGLRFGVCAIIALLHDVGIVIGSFAILGKFWHWEIDSLFVTALLTIIGFSVHDTIVIFDRIRENLRHRARGEAFSELVNRSILQSFARSINTSLTVVLTLVALLVIGAPNIKHFVVALLIGIVSGTYSSIFNASQLLVLWERLTGKQPVGGTAPARSAAVKSQLKPLAPEAGDSNGVTTGQDDSMPLETGGTRVKSKKRKRRF